uniref:Fibronectin type-III domain-containing protein n=1 Tax=Neogobius melanostomus TaxID=47308 RepID=A0A8C6TS59_9GOBI
KGKTIFDKLLFFTVSDVKCFPLLTDVDCTVIHLKYVECLWNRSDVNYTFYSKCHGSSFRECDSYIIRDNNNGCQQPEDNLKSIRFNTFQTKLEWGEKNERIQEHKLEAKVKLYPPTNLTVQYGPDSNLWFKWRQIFTHCVESEVRYRVNDEDWESTVASSQDYCINLPSNSSLYELQVRSRVSDSCGQSEEWSDWSQPVLWGNRNLARAPLPDSPMVWHVVLYCVGGATLLLLLVMLLHNERIRIILIPVVPKPSLVPHDLQVSRDK